MALVFVYGTLKSGHYANHKMKNNGTHITDGFVSGTLISLGAFPAYFRSGDTAVRGELWEVSEDGIKCLDAYESEGSLYDRVYVDFISVNGVEMKDVWAYEYRGSVKDGELISDGEWIGSEIKTFF